MASLSDKQISRRSAVALAAALAATVATAVAAYGGIAHWRTQGHPPTTAHVVQQAPAPPQFAEETD
jgi:hypothetical protein